MRLRRYPLDRVLAALALFIALVASSTLAIAAPDDAPGVFPNLYREGETVVVGSLIKADAGSLVIDAGQAGEVTAPVARGSDLDLVASGNLDLVKVGAIIGVRAKVRLDAFYSLQEPSVTLYLEKPRRGTKIELDALEENGEGAIVSNEPSLPAPNKTRDWLGKTFGDNSFISLFGTVVSTDPLTVRCVSDTRSLSIADFKADKTGTLLINGAKFTIATEANQSIEVSLGTAWQLLGEKPAIHVRVLQSTNSATRRDLRMPGGGPVVYVGWIRRLAALTADDLKAPKKAKRGTKVRPSED